MSMIFGLCFAWRPTIVLKTAHIVVGKRRIDVTTFMRKIPHNLRRKSPVLQRLLRYKCGDLQNAVQHAVQHATLGPGKALCYMDITYTCHTWVKSPEKIYRHVYAFNGVSSRIQYPPTYKDPPPANSIKSATLIYRNSASTTSLSVKDRLVPLGGQMGDFHRHSEYQLKKKVLELVLEPDISSLVHENPSHMSSSNDSLKSMTSSQTMSVRLVFEKPDQRSKVVRLDYASTP